ncbi:MliC family protein [Dyella jiangningensis]|uniref:C-type lysozyme inhibitor domain-containing protein n=1 Tax=Dyella jiangningensis TaxID=1379159 RepID=A0A328P0F9_9GAMM|nr:MliC family protein [Dyella jiangningensis]RAO74863.1 hypothetical protein CA260_18845 [Dyella jiangningensis]
MRPCLRPLLRIAVFGLTALPPAAALAETQYLQPIPVDGSSARDYQCQGGKSLQVSYFNQRDGQSFAILTVGNKRLLFVDTVAASGVKYMAGRYTWWTKGERGDLYDALAGPNAAPMLSACMARATK